MVEPQYRVRFYEGLDGHFRPEHVPDHFLIFNAPRPLFASVSPGPDPSLYEWTNTNGRRGWFFAAVDPADERYEDLVRRNNDYHGHLCIWVTAEEVRRVVTDYYTHEWSVRQYDGKFDPSEILPDWRSWVNAYQTVLEYMEGLDQFVNRYRFVSDVDSREHIVTVLDGPDEEFFVTYKIDDGPPLRQYGFVLAHILQVLEAEEVVEN